MQLVQRRILFIGVLILGLVWIGFSRVEIIENNSNPMMAPQEGFVAPGFSLQTLEGKTVKLSDLRGQVILLNFWATWCPPCRAEMPAIQRIYETHRDEGFIVLAVNLITQDQREAVEDFIQEHNLTFHIPLDVDNAVSRLYQVDLLPSTFFIDRRGMIREVIIGGPMAEALLITRVEALLEEIP